MSHLTKSCAFLASKALPWVLAAAVPVACAARNEGESVGQVSSALTTTIGVQADSHVRSGSASTNYGTATTCLADGDDAGSTLIAYVKVAVGDVGTISDAKLRVYVSDGTSSRYNVMLTDGATWNESTITWNSRPVLTTQIGR